MIRLWVLVALVFAGLGSGQTTEVLFDGKDASQWTGGVGEAFPSSAWKVEDGTLHTVLGSGRNLFSRKQYTDFDLTWEWKLTEGGNSGVKYQCVEGRIDPDTDLVFQGTAITVYFTMLLAAAAFLVLWRDPPWIAGTWARRSVMLVAAIGTVWSASVGIGLLRERSVAKRRPPGFEYQMIDDRTQHGDRLHTTGSLYDLLAAPLAEPRALGEWNESRVVVKGVHVEHWLNGRLVLAYDLGSPQLREAVSKSKFRKIDGFADKTSGYLMLQHHGTPAWFRNMRIRENP